MSLAQARVTAGQRGEGVDEESPAAGASALQQFAGVVEALAHMPPVPVRVFPVYQSQTGLYFVDIALGGVDYQGYGPTVSEALTHLQALVRQETGLEIPVRVYEELS